MTRPGTAGWALWPLSAAYGAGALLRAGLYRRGVLPHKRLGGVVISVGNLTVGGTGKTPMVIWLAERLAAEGHRPAILTRGYRGKVDARGSITSDEVELLRARLGDRAQLGVGKDRYACGRELEQQGARWFILDDGFQHLSLARDADIVLLDAADPFGGGRALPAGRLREPRRALGRADIVVITRTERSPAVEAIARRWTAAPVFYARTELESVLRAPEMMKDLPEQERSRQKFFAFCGIGNPAAFFDDLRHWGFSVAGERRFRDHHCYTADEAQAVAREARAAGAETMVCTEKDVFNLRGMEPIDLPVYACRIRLRPTDPEGLWKAVRETIQRRRGGG